eukprot:3520879-Rhodomonas_salina.1
MSCPVLSQRMEYHLSSRVLCRVRYCPGICHPSTRVLCHERCHPSVWDSRLWVYHAISGTTLPRVSNLPTHARRTVCLSTYERLTKCPVLNRTWAVPGAVGGVPDERRDRRYRLLSPLGPCSAIPLRSTPPPPYGHPAECPVLSRGMLLPGESLDLPPSLLPLQDGPFGCVPAMILRRCYAMSGNDVAYTAPWLAMVLRSCFAMSGLTEGTRYGMGLWRWYAMSGSEIGCGGQAVHVCAAWPHGRR